VHLDGHGGYKFASVGVLTCDRPDGDYQYLKSFRPLGKESRDIGQFVDDDGSAYLIFECRPTKGFYIAKLSDDYLDVAKEVCLLQAPLEGGAVFGGAVVGVQGDCSAGNQHLRRAVHPHAQSHRHQDHERDLHGRPLAARRAMGFTLFVDAIADRGRQPCAARAQAMDARCPDGRSRHPALRNR
jgi:hypothetical protein